MHRVKVKFDWLGWLSYGNKGWYLKCNICGEISNGLIPVKRNAKVRAREHELYGPK